MNSKNCLFLGMPRARCGYWQIVFVSIVGLGLILGSAWGDSPTPVASGSPEPAKVAPDGTINLEAVAHKRLPNTVADVVLGIQVEGRTADAVSSALAQRSQTLLDFLRQQGAERLRTEDVEFQPQVESVRGTDRIVGYSGSGNVSFRTTPDKVGTILTGSLEHGANTVSQTQFSPLESEVEAARRDLEIEGTKTALARAAAIAEAVGLRVLRVEQITVTAEENVVPMGGLAMGKAEAAAPAPAIQTASGEQEVTVRVAVQVGVAKRE